MSSRTEAANPDNISLALNTLDSLKLAELQNYFGNDCVLTSLNEVDRNFANAAEKTAIFSTALLGDRVAVILNLFTQSPTGEEQTLQQFEWIIDRVGGYIDQAAMIAKVNEYRGGLEKFADALGGYDPTLAQQIYDWVIRPFEAVLAANEIQTLVFVQDGIFRSVPMAALHNGEAFLIEKYAIATTPSLKLTNFEVADRQGLRALAAGVTQQTTVDGTIFSALRFVDSELEAIQEILPRSVELRDQDFTIERFKQILEEDNYPIIHIATHGKFSAEAENAFLVTGAGETRLDQQLTLNILDDIIRRKTARTSVELLVLSACQTATGDDRAALGLAGIAAQAGAKRVLASLWSTRDRATTELVTRFYQGLSDPEITQAQALQAAQTALIRSGGRTAHPAFWSAFILVGNWL
ncbi:MAG: CHAT domain-containing protein [Leptolyngbyaceae cyanobacterium SM1_3_5]|nr:CHAT domain-containing protein [Leptolyngbyaceae cyanobacterium SM1_3_5]